MGSFSMTHWALVLLVVMLLFGGGRISALMGDVAKGIKSFKKGIEDDEAGAGQLIEGSPMIDKNMGAGTPEKNKA